MPRKRTLRQLLKRAKLTHRELAAKTGYHWTYFSKMARGERSPRLIDPRAQKMAKVLGVSLEELGSIRLVEKKAS